MPDTENVFREENREPVPKYSGAAWRSRFLRAPKVALELAARTDFVALKDLD